MTRYVSITTANEAIWTAHGRAMASTFDRHWPSDVMLCVYAEEFTPKLDDDGRFGVIDLEVAAPWLATWKALYRDPRYNGGPNRRDYRHDAVRFAHKVAAIGAAAEDADCDVLIWMDADIVTHAPVTRDWLDSLFPEPAVVAWLDRWRTYPECGFLMFRMPQARVIIRTIVKAYRNGAIFQLPEWHDSFVIQHYVQKARVPVASLSGPEGRKRIGHPFANSLISCKLDHLKGEIRKQIGRTPKEQRHIKDDVAYWR